MRARAQRNSGDPAPGRPTYQENVKPYWLPVVVGHGAVRLATMRPELASSLGLGILGFKHRLCYIAKNSIGKKRKQRRMDREQRIREVSEIQNLS